MNVHALGQLTQNQFSGFLSLEVSGYQKGGIPQKVQLALVQNSAAFIIIKLVTDRPDHRGVQEPVALRFRVRRESGGPAGWLS